VLDASQHLAGLAIDPGGVLDLRDRALTLDDPDDPGQSLLGSWNGSSYTGLTGQIAGGTNASIVSSLSDPPYTMLGIAQADASHVALRYTYGGDANLDGKLNIDDYIKIDNGIASVSAGWSNGDFNYDGKVNIDDYTIIDENLPIQGPPIGNALSGGAAAAGGAGGPTAGVTTQPAALSWTVAGDRAADRREDDLLAPARDELI
jgi:hypothetical protein